MKKNRLNSRRLFGIVVFIVACIACSSLFFSLSIRWNKAIRDSLAEYTLLKDEDVDVHFDSITWNDDRKTIVGWYVVHDNEYEYYNYGLDAHALGTYNYMHLGYIDGEKVYILPTKLYEREDVRKIYYGDDRKAFCGFQAVIPADEVGTYEEMQMVLLIQDLNGEKYIYNVKQL